MPSEICPWAVPAVRTSAMTTETIFIMPSTPFAVRSRRLHPQILVELVHARLEPRVRDHVDDPPVLHHVVPVGHRGCEMEVLLDQQDGEPLRLEPPDDGADVLHDDRRQPFGGLVEQEQAGAGPQYSA